MQVAVIAINSLKKVVLLKRTTLLIYLSIWTEVIKKEAQKSLLLGKKANSSSPNPKIRKKAAMSQASTKSYRTIKHWSFNDSRAIKINKKIMYMIAMDNQPFTITSDQEFIELLATLEPWYLIPSTKYFTDIILPKSKRKTKVWS